MPTTIAERLQRAAKARGYTSDRSKSGVDVTALSEAIGASYEMARRYAEGTAIPSPEIVRKMSTWLRVSPTWLLYGDGPMQGPADIDVSLLETCLAAAAEAEKIAGIKLSEAQRAALVAALYRQSNKGAPPSPDTVAATLAALAR
jgi:transcriptional regulator with XRE-family HTH domain